ncbi:hypothetical protein [Kitasatospora sp. NPDC057198]|uniref:hypothetical protein n=1 Tax=Kitasatospora sp. NPDC057198 TaxID=3346046 RepID=UPI0036418DC5
MLALLRPEEQVFTAMLTGFANQQLARNPARTTVEGRKNTVKAFAAYVNAHPWHWTPAMADEWLGDLRSRRDLLRSTIRSYSEAVRAFCHFVTDPPYAWAATCEERFGTHPVQVVHEWNTAVHVQDNEADAKKGAFTEAELHAFFEHCDDEVARNSTLASLGRLDIDAWSAENTERGRTCLRPSLNRALRSRRCPRSLSVPAQRISRRPAPSEDERLAAPGRLLTGTDAPKRLRVAGVIVILHAQPLTRIVRLTGDDVLPTERPRFCGSGNPPRPSPHR